MVKKKVLPRLESVRVVLISSPSTGMLDLNNLIPANSGWFLQIATAIDNLGQIVGEGTLKGQAEAFLLTPQ